MISSPWVWFEVKEGTAGSSVLAWCLSMYEQRRAWVNAARMDSAAFINPSLSNGMCQMFYNTTAAVSYALCRFDVYH